ncbi:pyruvate decarboxylase [Fusarium pseudocircinatum]|uniref:Pyruvate decarboxylase n=1 Tax=Fusarium pseudocircinatum TaxID=56676 RepID=A0A8H5PTT7_9HYPO|nr:pyruvate decarboxylase [Fusarium pseudocircinatum]
MADPLSIASGVAGFVSLGLTLCGGLHNYFDAVKDCHQDIETASQNLDLLQSNIFIIQSSTLKLGHRHALSANGVNQDLTRAEDLSGTKGKLKRQKMIARYPFDQKKLLQLQDQLSRANATLSNFVQNFHLDINISISEDLQVLRTYTNDNDSITHDMLGTIARRLDTIGPALQRTEIEVAAISRHIQDNISGTSSRNPD